MAEKNKKRKGCFHTLKAFFWVCLGVIVTIGAVCCAICPHVPTADFPYAALFGLAFWPLFFADMFIIVVLLISRSYRAVIFMLLSAAVLVPGLLRSYSFSSRARDDDALKIMSYNVGYFWDYDNKTRDKKIVKKELFEMVSVEKPDIICLQETGTWSDEEARRFAERTGTKYYRFFNEVKGVNAVFSKYEIDTAAMNNITLENNDCAIIIDTKHNGKFALVVLHLTSFSFSSQEMNYMNGEMQDTIDANSVAKGILKKLSDGFRRRGEEMNTIVDNLPKGDIPCIVCGDFNETPLSNTYTRMRNAGFKDAFIEVGKGLGVTYGGRIPLLRIDYIWHNDLIVPSRFDVVKHKNSDHYPVVMSFHIVR